MAKNFLFKSLKIDGYRNFKELEIPKLKRVNIIGGYNGSGKTTILEALFFIIDRKNPVAALRPFMWRKVDGSGAVDLSQLSFNSDTFIKPAISCETRIGKQNVTLSFEPPPTNISFSLPNNTLQKGAQPSGMMGDTFSNGKGVNITFRSNGQDDDACYLLESANGVLVNLYRAGRAVMPACVFLNSATRASPHEDSVRFSHIMKSGRYKELLDAVKMIEPSIQSLQLLQLGETASIHAMLDNNSLLPIHLLGDGLLNIVTTTLAIMASENGVVFLDEMDTAVHYSKLSELWSFLTAISNKYNCQIFATTHSKEAIFSAVEGASKSGRQQDLQYIRIERNNIRHSAVSYDYDDIKSASEFDMEVR